MIGPKQIVDYFSQKGLDAPKVARLGRVYVMGPQPKSVQLDIGEMMVAQIVQKAQADAGHPIKIKIDEGAVKGVVDRLTTIELGMREVNRGFEDVIKRPLGGILSDIPAVREIELKVGANGKFQWLANGKEVALEGIPINKQGLEERNWNFVSDISATSRNRTPQLTDLKAQEISPFTKEAVEAVATHEVYGHWMTEALLNRKNGVEAISLYPGKGYLGYVRPLSDELLRVSDLSSLLKEAIVLNAGHRAVFVKGRYATGGGDIDRAKDAPPNDDLGKIEKIKQQLINNRLLPGITENSSPQEVAEAKRFLGEFFDEAADNIIRDGLNSKEFDEIYRQVLADRFMAQEQIEELLAKVDMSKFGTMEEFFTRHVDTAMSKALKDWGEKYGADSAKRLSLLAAGVQNRVKTEAGIHARDVAQRAPTAQRMTQAVRNFCQRGFAFFGAGRGK